MRRDMGYHRDPTHKQCKDQMHREEHSTHLQISGITLSGRIRPHRAAVGVPTAGGRTAHVAWYHKTVSEASCAETAPTYDRERAGRVSAGNLGMAYFRPRSQPCQGVKQSKGDVGKDMHLAAGIT